MIAPSPDHRREISQQRVRLSDTQSEPEELAPLNAPNFATRAVANHPIVSLAAASIVGVALGWLVKRQL
jgi:ElaB/YqjD/DUF883 family membrane-anchored ribosome-binding protein